MYHKNMFTSVYIACLRFVTVGLFVQAMLGAAEILINVEMVFKIYGKMRYYTILKKKINTYRKRKIFSYFLLTSGKNADFRKKI